MRNNVLAITLIISITLFFTGCGQDNNKNSTYSVGGMMNGLSGTVVLQNNGKNDLNITSNGAFIFTTSFATGSTYAVTVLTQPTGQICSVAKRSGTISSTNVIGVVVSCYNSGTLDPTFNNDGLVIHNSAAEGDQNDSGNSITIDSKGRILVTGYSYSNKDSDMAIWRYNSDGTPDFTFGTDGVVVHDNAAGGDSNDRGNSITIDSKGRILVTGYSYSRTDSNMAIWRYSDDGYLDATFGNDGIVLHHGGSGNGITINSNGKILVTGYSDNGFDLNMTIWRYDTDGSPDSTFGTDGVVIHKNAAGGDGFDVGNSITIDSSGRILVTGYSDNGFDLDMVIWRYNTDGTPDFTFGTDGVVVHNSAAGGDRNDVGNSITIDSNDKILVTGYSDNSVDLDMVIWKYDTNGTPDSTFGTDGIVVHDNAAGGDRHDIGNSITIDSKGRILVTGRSMNSGHRSWSIVIWRYDSNGTRDTTFGSDGIVINDNISKMCDSGNSIIIDSNGRILIAGTKNNYSGNSDMVIWRVIQ